MFFESCERSYWFAATWNSKSSYPSPGPETTTKGLFATRLLSGSATYLTLKTLCSCLSYDTRCREWGFYAFSSSKSTKYVFDVSVTVHHWYNNINSQLDVTIIILFNHLNMFRAIMSPNLRSTRLCLQLVVYSTDDEVECCLLVSSRQHRQCIIPQAVNTD